MRSAVALTYLASVTYGATVTLDDDDNAKLVLDHWISGEDLYFQGTLTDKVDGTKTTMNQTFALMPDMSKLAEMMTEIMAKVMSGEMTEAEVDEMGAPDGFTFLSHGVSFTYAPAISMKLAMGMCQEDPDKDMVTGADCGWTDEPTMWNVEDAMMWTGAAKRPLAATTGAVKEGENYMVMGRYQMETEAGVSYESPEPEADANGMPSFPMITLVEGGASALAAAGMALAATLAF